MLNAYADFVDWVVRAAANALALLGGVTVFLAAAVATVLFPLPAIALLVLTGGSVMVAKSMLKG